MDPEAYNKALIESLHEKVNTLALMVRSVQLELEGLKGGAGRGGAGGAAAQPRSTADAIADASARADVFATRTPTGDAAAAGIKPLHPAVLGVAAGADGGAAGAAKAGAGGGGSQKLTNVLFFFLIYFAFQWLGGQKD